MNITHYLKISTREGHNAKMLERVSGIHNSYDVLHAYMDRANSIFNMDFSNVNLNRSSYSTHIIQEKRFKKCNFNGADLTRAWFSQCEFVDCIFDEANLYRTRFSDDCVLDNCTFGRANMDNVLLNSVFLKRCDIRLLGTRYDGYNFYLQPAARKIIAGCQYLTVEEAMSYWHGRLHKDDSKLRTQLNNESIFMVCHALMLLGDYKLNITS